MEKLHSEEYYDLKSLLFIPYTTGDVGNHAGKQSLGIFIKLKEDNIKIYVKDNSVRSYKQD
jgi:hypothetical protein